MQLAEYPAKLVTCEPVPESAPPKMKGGAGLVFLDPDEDAQLLAANTSI